MYSHLLELKLLQKNEVNYGSVGAGAGSIYRHSPVSIGFCPLAAIDEGHLHCSKRGVSNACSLHHFVVLCCPFSVQQRPLSGCSPWLENVGIDRNCVIKISHHCARPSDGTASDAKDVCLQCSICPRHARARICSRLRWNVSDTLEEGIHLVTMVTAAAADSINRLSGCARQTSGTISKLMGFESLLLDPYRTGLYRNGFSREIKTFLAYKREKKRR